jgi:hypothetical protein
MTSPARFKQSDLRRAVKAVEGLGYEEVRVSIDLQGRLEITVRKHVNDDEMDQEALN